MVVLGAKICSEDLVAGYMRKIPHLEEFPRIYFIFMVEFLYIHSILAVKGGDRLVMFLCFTSEETEPLEAMRKDPSLGSLRGVPITLGLRPCNGAYTQKPSVGCFCVCVCLSLLFNSLSPSSRSSLLS